MNAAAHPTLFMKTRFKQPPLTFGEFVAGACHAWGKRKAKGIVKLAIKTNLIEFRGTERYVII
jgi:hypothetical protein